ncbi:MAG: two pore domain potassium channel family protein [Frondihabitans sp.]|nr:two pore domain potassium channel family protein [Frondihabitans sp.]
MTQESWLKRTQWPLLGVSLLFLAAYSVQVIANVPVRAGRAIDVIIWVTWAVFGIDYVVNLVLARNRRRWFVRNLWQLAILALPALRPLRLLQLLNVLRVVHRTGGNALRGRLLTNVLGAAVIVVYMGALAVLSAEENAPGSNIRTFGNALWWAIVTITTIGYGDFTPVTLLGRLIAVGLMISGIAVLGVVTASLSSWLVERVSINEPDPNEKIEESLRHDISRLTTQVERLTERLDSVLTRVGDGSDST